MQVDFIEAFNKLSALGATFNPVCTNACTDSCSLLYTVLVRHRCICLEVFLSVCCPQQHGSSMI